MAEKDVFELFGPARLTPAGGSTFNLLATLASQVYERRIIIRRRPNLDGAPLDDSGAEPKVFEVSVLFANGHDRADIPQPTYPDYHARFLEAVEVEGVATFYMPGRGEKRVRIKRVASELTAAMRNAEIVTLSLLEDNEDGRVTSDSFALPSAKSAGPVLAQRLAVDAGALGMGGDLLSAINRLTTQVEAAASSPFDSAAEVQQRAGALIATCKRFEAVGMNAERRFGQGAFSPLATPEAVLVVGLVRQLEDNAAGQQGSLFGTATTRPRTFDRWLSIFEIATLLDQDAAELCRLNSRLPSLFAIAPGTTVITRA